MYWYASRIFDPDIDIEPCPPLLKGPYKTREEAKKSKLSDKNVIDVEQTEIFQSPSADYAKELIKNLSWSRWL